jgi:hypothetical protein
VIGERVGCGSISRSCVSLDCRFCHESCYGRGRLSDVVANISCTFVMSFTVKRMPSKKKKYNARFPAVSFALYVKDVLIMYTPFLKQCFSLYLHVFKQSFYYGMMLRLMILIFIVIVIQNCIVSLGDVIPMRQIVLLL